MEKLKPLEISEMSTDIKSVKSINQCKSVIQTKNDITTQGHDGHLEVETEQGQGTRFILRLPVVWIISDYAMSRIVNHYSFSGG